MMMDTRIYGYIGDGAVYSVADVENGLAGLQPIYSLDDDGNGLYTDDGVEIFAPSFDLVYSSDDVPGLNYRSYGDADELEAWTEDHEDGSDTPLVVEVADTDYGQAYVARTEDGTVAVIWATPDHPSTIEGVEVES